MLFVLRLALVFNGIAFSGAVLKEQFNKLINGKSQKIEIKNRTYYFYNDIINIEEFDSNVLKIDKESYKDTDIYYIGYMAI